MKADMSSLAESAQEACADSVHVRAGLRTAACFLAFVILAPFFADGESDSGGQGNLLRQVAYMLIFVAALFCARIGQRPAVLLRLPATLLMTLAWFFLSVAWASNPAVACRRLALTLVVIWTVFLLVDTVGYEGMVRSVRRILAMVLLMNFCAVLVMPEWAIHQTIANGDPSIVGAWRGVLMQKNFAGVACALTVIFFAFDADDVKPACRWIVIAGAAAFLSQTNSSTSMFVMLMSISVGLLVRFYRPFYRWVWGVLLVLSTPLIVFIVAENTEAVTALFADPDAFTGRVQIWTALIHYARDHVWLGSGYGSFWNAGEPHALAYYTRGWVLNAISSGHSGFLDMLVQTGLPGLLLVIITALLAPVWTFMTRELASPRRAGLLLALIAFCFVQNFTESGLFDRDATVQVFLMIGIALLHAEARKP